MRSVVDHPADRLGTGSLDWASLGQLVRAAALQAVGLDLALSAAESGQAAGGARAVLIHDDEVEA